MSATMGIVDAVDITNTVQGTEEFDHSMKNKELSHDKNYEKTLSDPEQIKNKIAKIERRSRKEKQET